MRRKQYARLCAAVIGMSCLFSFAALAQSRIDSLEKQLEQARADTSRVNLLIALSVASRPDNINRAIAYAEEALSLAERLRFWKGQIDARLRLASHVHHRGNFSRARNLLLAAADITQKQLDGYKLADIHLDLGMTYRRLSMVDSAFYYFTLAESGYEASGNRDGLSKVFINFGRLYLEVTREFDKAETFLLRAREFIGPQGDRMDRGFVLYLLANLYFETEQYDRYYEIEQDWVAFQREKGAFTRRIAFDRAHTSLFYMFSRDTLASLRKLRRAVEQMGPEENPYLLAWLKEDVGKIYHSLGQYDIAESYLLNAEAMFREQKESFRRSRVLAALYKLYKQQGRYAAALGYLEACQQLADSLQAVDMRQHLNELEVAYETEKKEQALRFRELELQQKTLERNLLLGSSLLLGLLALSIFLGLRTRLRLSTQERRLQEQQIRQLKQEKRLTTFNAMIDGQEKERLRIARDLHDSLGGLLTTVKAYFGSLTQHDFGKDQPDLLEQTNHLIDEACTEVRRISHNMMPSALARADLAGALEDLAFNLRRQGLNCDLELNRFDPQSLSAAQQVMIYRIVQELAHNVVKHARAENLLIQFLPHGDELTLIVEDDGVGFDPQKLQQAEGIGIRNIRSRVEFLNGEIEWDPAPGHGATVNLRIPVSADKLVTNT